MRGFRFFFFFLITLLATQTIKGQDTFGDNFNSAVYSNNNGTHPFLGSWVESNETTNPTSGRILITTNRLRFQNLDGRFITRNLNLSAYISATLTLDYARTSGTRTLNVQLFNGTTFVTVATIPSASSTGSLTYNLAANEMSSSSAIRITSSSSSWGGSDEIFIDNIVFTALADQPPLVIGSGDQVYCPSSSVPIVDTISISDPDDTSTSAVYIQISNGYVNGEDLLTLTGSHPNITSSWDAVQGELTLQGPATYTEFETAILATHFSSSSASPSGTRQFSITVGEPNFLPSTGHYYEFVSAPNISWTDAETAASLRTYFGLQGYLATLTTQQEADFSGSQAQGVGWIGANDAAVEGEWRWVTGPEAGTQFWNGDASGTLLTYAFWNNGEPNDYPNNAIPGEENYAHITDPSVTTSPGSWNDLPNVTATSGAYAAQGYVVEYGGMPGDPALNITATTTLRLGRCTVITNRKITYRVNRD